MSRWLAALFASAGPWLSAQSSTLRVSDAWTAAQGNGHSAGATSAELPFACAVARDGAVVAFWSHASNLMPNDRNQAADVFVRDRRAGRTFCVSLDPRGAPANGQSRQPALTPDGRFVVFASAASNLVSGDFNGVDDVFLHDRHANRTRRVSIDSSGGEASLASGIPGTRMDVTPDGRFVLFTSAAPDLVPGDGNNATDVFRHDTLSGATVRTSVTTGGAEANAASVSGAISADGRLVVFSSHATNLGGAVRATSNVYLRDLTLGVTTLLSVATSGLGGNADSDVPVVSADGSMVAFASRASDLIPGGTGFRRHVFVRDLRSATTFLASQSSAGQPGDADSAGYPSVSDDGRVVAFHSAAANLVAGDGNGVADAFLRDPAAGLTVRASVGNAGEEANAECGQAALSADGGHVAFATLADNLVTPDVGGLRDVFVRDLSPYVPAPLALRLSIKRILDRNGNPSPGWRPVDVQTLVGYLDAIFRRNANLTFQLVEPGGFRDLVDPGLPYSWFDTLRNRRDVMEAAAEADPCTYGWRTDAINLYLCHYFADGDGICSAPGCGPTNDDIMLAEPRMLLLPWRLSHEMGHWLDLRHTHARFEPPFCSCPAGVFADCVADTPDDADPTLCNPFAWLCHETNMRALGLPPDEQALLRFNVMSYHGPMTSSNALFSPGQAQRMLSTLFTARGRVLVGGSFAALTTVTPANAIYPGLTVVTLTGTNLPATGLVTARAGEQVSLPAVGTPNQLTVTFAVPVAPGAHCVTVIQDGQALAFRPGLEVAPHLVKTLDPTLAELRLAFTVTAPGALVLALAGPGPTIPAVSIPPVLHALRVLPAVILPLATGPDGRAPLSIPLAALPPGAVLCAQGLELDAQLAPRIFTNGMTIAVP